MVRIANWYKELPPKQKLFLGIAMFWIGLGLMILPQ